MNNFYENNIKTLIKNTCDKDVYSSLAEKFKDLHLYREQAGCLEAFLNIEEDPFIYMQYADILAKKLEFREFALIAYNNFLRMMHPEFYKNYAKNLIKMGYKGFEPEEDEKEPELVKLLDKYCVITYCVIALLEEKNYTGALNIKKYLLEFLDKVHSMYDLKSARYQEFKQQFKNASGYLSIKLSNVKNHNDINRFAIEFNEDNKEAYINIIDDLITYGNYQEAIEYFNNTYAIKFAFNSIDCIKELCWHVSDYYASCYNFYDAVKFQKLALELELEV